MSWMTQTEAAAALGCSIRTVRRRIRAGSLTARREGRRLLVEIDTDRALSTVTQVGRHLAEVGAAAVIQRKQDADALNDHILVDSKTPVATVTFNRPSQRNAINFEMWRQFAGIMEKLDADRGVRAVVITGAGQEAVSAGADIQDFEEHRSDSTKGRGYNDAVNGALKTLTDMDTPTISMIRGFAVGGGCELAVATDLRIASDNSRMGIPVGKLGISIGHREMRGLVNLVGKGNAMYILLSARLLDAQESLRIGLVNQVVKHEELEDYTYKLASDIASLAPLSHAVNKLTMRQVQNKPSLENLTEKEADLPLTQFDTKDYLEGYKAFLEKRRPNFIGK